MDLAPDFRDLFEELARGNVDFVIVGGYAVAFHGRPRATKDIDDLIANTRAAGRPQDLVDAEVLERIRAGG